MRIVKIIVLLFAGLISVIATESGVMAWLTYAPRTLDLTGNYFTMTILPVVLLVVVAAALLLWKILAANPVRNCLIFSTVYIVAEVGVRMHPRSEKVEVRHLHLPKRHLLVRHTRCPECRNR